MFLGSCFNHFDSDLQSLYIVAFHQTGNFLGDEKNHPAEVVYV